MPVGHIIVLLTTLNKIGLKMASLIGLNSKSGHPGGRVKSKTYSVGLTHGNWGTLFNVETEFPTRGLYLWQTNHNENYTYSAGFIFNGNAGGGNRRFFNRIQSGSYTDTRLNGNDFQVYHGISWAGSLTFYGRWELISELDGS